jgi:hypothetical protein
MKEKVINLFKKDYLLLLYVLIQPETNLKNEN